jgi:hypothetical protein
MADKPRQMLLDPGFELTLRPMRWNALLPWCAAPWMPAKKKRS